MEYRECTGDRLADNVKENANSSEASSFARMLTNLSAVCAIVSFLFFQLFPTVTDWIGQMNASNDKQLIEVLDISNMSHNEQLAYSSDLINRGYIRKPGR